MTIMQIPQYWNKNILILGLIAVLTACGGGGGGNDNDPIDPPPPVSDTTPDNFTFTAVTNADVSAPVESNSITVDGINAAAAISITGGEYKIASGEYTSSNSTVTDGQSVTVRLTTPEAGNQTREATLLIGGVSATFTVTTRPDDTTPDAFSFTAVTDAAVGAEVTSEAITISGINAAASISVENGFYEIDDNGFTNASGTITNGQIVKVRLSASSKPETDASAILTIGGTSTSFVVTTLSDTTPPTAQISFPPPMSMKEAETLTIRGTATDDVSAIAELKVKVGVTEYEVVTDNGYADWTAEVSLAEGENEIVIDVIDTSENSNPGAASVVVHRSEESGSFPDDENPITYGNHLTFDKARNRVLVTNLGAGGGFDGVITVDMATGLRALLPVGEVPENEVPFAHLSGIFVDANSNRNRVLILDMIGKLYAIDLESGERSLLSDVTTPNDQQPDFIDPINITQDPNNTNVAYIVDEAAGSLQRVDLTTGKRELVSDNSITEHQLEAPRSVLIDSSNNRALVADGSATVSALFSVNLETGAREVISDLSNQDDLQLYGGRAMASANLTEEVFYDTGLYGIVKVDLNTGARTKFFDPFSTDPSHTLHSLYLEPNFSYLFYLDNRTQGVYAIDLKNAEYVVISKSQTPE